MAALRMNLPVRYFYVPNGGGLGGIAMVVSRTSGFTLTVKLSSRNPHRPETNPDRWALKTMKHGVLKAVAPGYNQNVMDERIRLTAMVKAAG